MNLLVLFGQRKCNYEGEYAPEVLDAQVDFHYSDYPDHFDKVEQDAIKSGDFEGVCRVLIKVNSKEINGLFATKTIEGEVKAI